MSKLAYVLTLRHKVAAWSDSILDDAVEFAKAHQHIFTGNNPPVGKSQLYGLMNLVQNTSNFGRVRYFTDHQAQKAEGRRNDAVEFWITLSAKSSTNSPPPLVRSPTNPGLNDLVRDRSQPDLDAIYTGH